MKKRIMTVMGVTVLLTALCVVITGCGCKHDWVDAACETPKTCSLCDVTEGEAAGHKWVAAACEKPKTCSACGKTEGEALGHSWADATCEAPKTCSGCGKTEGEMLEHTWVDATCEAPKTCSGCGKTEGEMLEHTWADATCAAPKTCSGCGKTEGEMLEHTWVNATCAAPKTCSGCGKTDGNALGHKWTAATCVKAKTCSVCSQTEGSALGHKWVDATTDLPKTCSVCQQTEGQRIMTDSRFKTAQCKQLFGAWKGTVNLPGQELVADDFTATLNLAYTITFYNNGTYGENVVVLNADEFNKALENYYIDALYAEFAQNGMTQAQADEAMKATYGMDVKTYAKMASVAVDWEAMFEVANRMGVYYVSDDTLYSGSYWTSKLTPDSYAVSETQLAIGSISADFPGLVFKRVS